MRRRRTSNNVAALLPGLAEATPSAGGMITRMVSARLRDCGIRMEPLLSKAHLTVEQIDNEGMRLKVQSQIRFLEAAADVLDDELLGFHLARDLDLREIGLLYYVLASSETMHDAMQKAERYSGIANESIALRFCRTGDVAIAFSYAGVGRHSDRHQIEFWLTVMVRLCRQLTNRRLTPTRIRVAHHRPGTPAKMKSLFGCLIEFGCDVDEVAFGESVRYTPFVGADRHLNRLLTAYCEAALAERVRSPARLRSSLENEVARLLTRGDVRAEDVARRLGMSHRTLARRLAAEGLSFSDVLHELKARLAKRYLRDASLPMSQIALLLGYGDGSAFTHAFRRWTGTTPRQFRQKLRQRDPGFAELRTAVGSTARPRKPATRAAKREPSFQSR